MWLGTTIPPGFLILLLMTSINLRPVNCSPPQLIVTGSGVLPAEIADVALRFYVTVQNVGSVVKLVQAQNGKCCLQDPGGDPDCKSMHLLGGRAFNVQHHQIVNVSLIYPNLYIFDRVGKCNINISAENTEGMTTSLSYSLSFDTSLVDNVWLPNPIKDWLMGVRSCESVDEDRTNACKPVNCVVKYDGTRNIYNIASKRCESTVNCMPSTDKDLPDKALKIDSNECKELNIKLSAEDLDNMAGNRPPPPEGKDIGLKEMYQFKCVHGSVSPDNTGCICDPGWESLERDQPTSNSADIVRVMCDVHDLDSIMAMKYRQSRVIMMVLGTFCGALLSVVLVLFFYSQIQIRRQQANESLIRSEMVRMTDLSKKNSFSMLSDGNPPPQSPKGEDTSVDFESARVHTPNMPLMDGELDLRIGDIITQLRKTPSSGMWKGTCNGVRGIFPVSCAELYLPGQGPLPHSLGDERIDEEDEYRPKTAP